MKPIKANLKFDKDGLGHDKAKDFTNHWWQNAYNDAADNIDVEHSSSADKDAVAITLKNGESIDVSIYRMKTRKTSMYSSIPKMVDFDERHFYAKNAKQRRSLRVRHNISKNGFNAEQSNRRQ